MHTPNRPSKRTNRPRSTPPVPSMASPSTSTTWAPSCWSPPTVPPVPEVEHLAAWVRELALGDLI